MRRLSDIELAKNKHEKVFISYNKEQDEKRTSILIVNGLIAHIGISKCFPSDEYNKKLGRTIALGRAELAKRMLGGESEFRDKDRREELFYTLVFENKDYLDEYISAFLSVGDKQAS